MFKALAKPIDVDVDGIVVRLGIHSPDFVHQLDPGKYFSGIGQKLIEKIKFFSGKRLPLFTAGDREGIIVQAYISYGDPVFTYDLRPAQQSPDPQ